MPNSFPFLDNAKHAMVLAASEFPCRKLPSCADERDVLGTQQPLFNLARALDTLANALLAHVGACVGGADIPEDLSIFTDAFHDRLVPILQNAAQKAYENDQEHARGRAA